MAKQMLNRIGLYYFIGLLTLFVLSPVYSQTSEETLKQNLQNVLDTKIISYGIEGAALTIVLPDEKIFTFTSGYATGLGDPVDTVRKWHWASCTKPLAGYVILKMIEDGTLNINDPIGNYLDTDTIPNVDSAITIKELLRHTGGLKEVWSETGVPDLWRAVWDNRDSVWQPWQVLKYMPAPFAQKSDHHYASTNTYLLSFIIEAVTGKNLGAVFKEQIFDPLEMKNSYLSSGKAFDMSDVNGAWNGSENRSTLSHNSYLSSRAGNSALISTPMDVANFYRNYYKNKLLSKATMDSLRVRAHNSDTLLIPANVANGVPIYQSYGYETEFYELDLTNKDTVIVTGHGGDGINGTAAVQWDREDITFVLAVNDMAANKTGRTAKLLVDLITELDNDLPIIATGVSENKNILHENFSVSQNYPNPFNPTTNIRYSIPKAGYVSITIYNSIGKKVESLVNKIEPAGIYNVTINGENLSSGVYYYQVKAGEYLVTKKMVLLK